MVGHFLKFLFLLMIQQVKIKNTAEEFLLVFPNARVEQAELLAEALRETIECYPWLECLQITSSFGVAQRAQQEGYTEFINRADKALYNAKAQGRNRVVCSIS